MNIPLSIRSANAGDMGALAELFLQVRVRHFYWVEREKFKIEDFAAETEGEDVYVAHEDGVVLGFISVWAPESFVHHLFVRTDCQRRGVGKALLEHAMKLYPFPLRLKCPEPNEQALGFYLKIGWKAVGNGVSDHGRYLLLQFEPEAK